MTQSKIHELPYEEVEHLFRTGTLKTTFLFDDFFITREFFERDGQFYMVARGIGGGIERIERRDTLVGLLLALVLDEVVYTPSPCRVEVEREGNSHSLYR